MSQYIFRYVRAFAVALALAAGSSCAGNAPPATAPVVTAPPPAVVVARDNRGRIVRSAAARRAFMRQTGYPAGRPGYVVDHVIPLACGGLDAPSNMQWQTVAEARAKDRIERIGC